jgi:hypothetical protein
MLEMLVQQTKQSALDMDGISRQTPTSGRSALSVKLVAYRESCAREAVEESKRGGDDCCGGG